MTKKENKPSKITKAIKDATDRLRSISLGGSPSTPRTEQLMGITLAESSPGRMDGSATANVPMNFVPPTQEEIAQALNDIHREQAVGVEISRQASMTVSYMSDRVVNQTPSVTSSMMGFGGGGGAIRPTGGITASYAGISNGISFGLSGPTTGSVATATMYRMGQGAATTATMTRTLQSSDFDSLALKADGTLWSFSGQVKPEVIFEELFARTTISQMQSATAKDAQQLYEYAIKQLKHDLAAKIVNSNLVTVIEGNDYGGIDKITTLGARVWVANSTNVEQFIEEEIRPEVESRVRNNFKSSIEKVKEENNSFTAPTDEDIKQGVDRLIQIIKGKEKLTLEEQVKAIYSSVACNIHNKYNTKDKAEETEEDA